MLQSIRKITRGAGAWLFVAAVALPLSFFGFSWVSSSEGNEQIAKINGEPIKRRDLDRRAYIERQRELIRQGEDANPDTLDEKQLETRALQVLLNDALIRQEAQARDLEISNAEVDRLIVRDFRGEDGGFSQEMYERALLYNGYTPSYYKQEVRGRLLRSQLLSFFHTDFLTDGQLRRLYPLYRQERDIRWVKFETAEAERGLTLEEEEIRARYQSRNEAEGYSSDEQVVVEYAVVRRSDFDAPPAENILLEYYQNESEYFSEIYVASHIFLEKGTRADEQAQRELNALRKRFLAGESFADLAREHSEDPASAPFGGYLGESKIGEQFAGGWTGAFGNALRKLQRGEVSGPTQTMFGWHLVYREELPEIPTYEQRRPVIAKVVREANAQDDYFNYLAELSDALPAAADLQSLPWGDPREIITEGPFTRSEAAGYFARQDLQRLVFSDNFIQGGAPAIFQWSAEESLIIRLKRHAPARRLDYEEARERVVAELRSEKARNLTDQTAREWMAKARAGEPLTLLAEEDDRELFESPGLGRADSAAPNRIRNAAFSMPHPRQGSEFRIVQLGKNTGVALLELAAVRQPEGESSEDAEARADFMKRERQLRGRLAARLFLGTLQLRTIVSDVNLD